MDVRIAISWRRYSPRASSKPPTFKQAVSNTRDDSTSRTTTKLETPACSE